MLPKFNVCDLKIYLGAFVRVQIIVEVRPVFISLQNVHCITAQYVPAVSWCSNQSTVLSHNQLNFIFTFLSLKQILVWLILAVIHSLSRRSVVTWQGANYCAKYKELKRDDEKNTVTQGSTLTLEFLYLKRMIQLSNITGPRVGLQFSWISWIKPSRLKM